MAKSTQITIDDPRLAADTQRNVRFLYGLTDAVKKDQLIQGHPAAGNSLREWERQINADYEGQLGNKTIIQAIRTFGKRQLAGKASKGITGSDVFIVSRFFLVNMQAYPWPNVEQYIASQGKPYSDLLQLKHKNHQYDNPVQKYEELAEKTLGDYISGEVTPGNKLREIATLIDGLERNLRISDTEKRIAIGESVKLRKQIKALLVAYERIQQAFDKAPTHLQDELRSQLEENNNMLRELQKRL